MDKSNKNSLKEVIKNVSKYFKINKYNNACLIEDTPDTIQNMVMNAHRIAGESSPILPSNFIYNTLYYFLEAVEACDSIEELYEIDIEPDVYHADLLSWLSSNMVRHHYLNEAIEFHFEAGMRPDFFFILQYAQSLEISDIQDVLIQFLSNTLEGTKNEEDEIEF